MGMAASQARYLALVARKSNCEYEGQQINQSRTVLSNQSANLFNQMLGLKVPVPPSTQDFTKIQYSYKDGMNNAVIDSWKQLSTADPDYNYVVTSHYYTDVYTGSIKKMTDPQVQVSSTSQGTTMATLAQIIAAKAALDNAAIVQQNLYNTWQQTKATQEAIIKNIQETAKNEFGNKLMNGILTDNNTAGAPTLPGANHGYRFTDSDTTQTPPTSPTVIYDIYSYDDPNNTPSGVASDITNVQSIFDELKNLVNLGVLSLNDINTALAQNGSLVTITDINQLNFDPTLASDPNATFTNEQIAILSTYALANEYDPSSSTPSTPIASYLVLNQVVQGTAAALPTASQLTGYQISGDSSFTTPSSYVTQINTAQGLIDADELAYDTYHSGTYTTAENDYNNLARPTYIGNCELTLLSTLTDDQRTEIEQIIKDMRAQGIDANINDYIDSSGNYLGGIYTFKLNGNTYYTTYDDLAGAYASNHNSNNYIDAQYKMAYYNASYISTKIETEEKALLETDENGRFTSVRFENDSVTYVLTMETITDDVAYQDAMNKYNYENAKYDKMVQDINAKTSIIQREDQQLELRLKQLDTEQKALSTEIDAVSKVVKENIDKSFKTFGD